MAAAPANTSHLRLGYVAGAHGVRGALRVKLLNADSDGLRVGARVVLGEPGDADARCLEVRRVTPKPGTELVRVWLMGVEDRETAEALRGRALWIERESQPALDDDEYYLADLVGLEVVREQDGRSESLGEVVGVTTNTAQDLLCVRLRGREWLLPALPPFIVGFDDRQLIVDVHDDMLPERS